MDKAQATEIQGFRPPSVSLGKGVVSVMLTRTGRATGDPAEPSRPGSYSRGLQRG